MEVVGGIASVVQLVQASKALHATFTAPKENRIHRRDLAQQIRLGVIQIEELTKQHPDRINIEALNVMLDDMGHDMRNLLNRIEKMKNKRKGWIAKPKAAVVEWWSADDIKQELERIEKKLTACYQRFAVGGIGHIAIKQEAMDQGQTQQHAENQTILRDINAKLTALVADPNKLSKAMNLTQMSTAELKTAKRKASKDLSREGIADQEAKYLQTKIHLLDEELEKREGQLTGHAGTTEVDKSKKTEALESQSLLRLNKPHPELWEHIPRTGDPSDEIQDAIRETMRLTQLLRDADPSPHGLADSLFELGLALSDLGWDAEAVTIGEWNVKLRRSLWVQDANKYGYGLATALDGWSRSLGKCGRYEGALENCEEALKIWRKLTTNQTDAFLPNFAWSLNNWSNRLSDFGRHEEALAATEEALTTRRKLASDRPDAFLPVLASSLYNLSIDLCTSERHEEALTAAEEACAAYRKLYRARPAKFNKDFKNSLLQMSLRLKSLDRNEEAQAFDDEAATVTLSP